MWLRLGVFLTSSSWEAALGNPGGCEMQGLCQGSDPWEMGAWRWDGRGFQRNKKMGTPHLCSGRSGLAALPPVQMATATTQGLAGLLLCPAQSCRATGTWGHLWGSPAPSWSFVAVPLLRAVLHTLWRAPVLGGGCCTPFLCHPPCPRLCEGGLWSQSFSPPTAEWISSPCQRYHVGGIGCWESLSRTSEAVSPAAQLPGPSRLF